MRYDLDLIALTIPCPYCQAEPGTWCRRRAWGTDTVTGRASYLHTARSSPASAAWRLGFGEAHRDILALARDRSHEQLVNYLERMLR